MRTWMPLTAVSLGSFLFLLDTTVLSVALPRIGAGLHASLSDLQCVANVYTLVLAALMLTMGRLADRWTARRVYLLGLALFGLASLGCALAPSAGALIAARGAQAVGGAALAVTSFALLGSVYRGPHLGRAMGVFGAVTGLAAATGPILGGLLTEYLGWRSIFLLNLPVAALTAGLSAVVLPPGTPGAPTRVDVRGTTTFVVGAGALTYASTRAGAEGWATPGVLTALVVAVCAGAAFVAVERAHPAPLLDVRLFARARFAAVMACVTASAVAFAALVYTSLWLQSGLGLAPIRAGLGVLPLAFASFVTSLSTGRRLHGRSPRVVLGVGLMLTGMGAALQTEIDGRSTAGSVAVGLTVTGVGVGLLGPAMGAAVLGALPPNRTGSAAGMMTTFRQFGQTLGVALLGVLFRSAGDEAVGLGRVMAGAAVVGLVGSLLAVVFLRPSNNATRATKSGR